ncbi:uncharacterized protein LOC131945955 [Physella acuta]|uniref:uncharacterized protein LOC131945955 n=1 Tax=Physella acuta TaxID=109671 RepID=UPI0027DC8187|nr:uncharacterized protein LOC131945955 [Physella acuta]
MSVLYALLVCLPALTFAQTFSLKPYDVTAAVAFTYADHNGDGVYDRNEVDLMFKNLDSNHDGLISLREYSSYFDANMHDPHVGHIVSSLFLVYDVNNDDHVDHHDFDMMFALADSNGDNLMQKTEFVHYTSVIFAIVDTI